MLNVLYIGPNDSEWAQANRPVGLAGAKWARGFLSALSKQCRVTALSHTYSYPWPKGDCIWVPNDKKLFNSGWDSVAIGYPALKYVRERYLAFVYPKVGARIIREKDIDAVLFYNCEYPHERKIINAFAKSGVPCFPIILDGDDPRKDNWGWLKAGTKNAAGVIALSWWVYKNWPTALPRYHFDGGAEGWRGIDSARSKEKGVKTLVHTGALDQWRGLDFMIQVVARLTAKRKDVRFVFCGKTSEKVLKETFGENPYVELPGFVCEERMEEICNGADVLLNVRDPKHPDNILNYPSKLPHYLSFGRPIVSTPLQSLSPDYADVVEFSVNDTIEAFAQKVEEVLAWDTPRRMSEYGKIKSWFERRKTWDCMVTGLVNWLQERVGK